MANWLNRLIEEMVTGWNGLNAFLQTQAIDCSAAIELQKGSAAVELQKGRKAKEEEKSERGMQLQG